MSFRPVFRSHYSILALAGLVAIALVLFSGGRNGTGQREVLPGECQGLTPQECRAALGLEDPLEPVEYRETVLQAREACLGVGYLCAEVETAGSLKLYRWPEDTQQIRIWVPEPAHLPPDLAREFQRAAARGIQAWHGHPIPLSVRTRERGEPPDVTVEWVQTMEENRLGRAEVEWTQRGEDIRVRVLGFIMATNQPGENRPELTTRQIELVAAHEMGHVLGLPHSDDSRDVMFPQNTATHLTRRDFRTIEAFYSLPNGAEIRR